MAKDTRTDTEHFRVVRLNAGEWGFSLDHRGEFGCYHLMPVSDEAKDWLNASELNSELESHSLPRTYVFNLKYKSLFALKFARQISDAGFNHLDNLRKFITNEFCQNYLPKLKYLKHGKLVHDQANDRGQLAEKRNRTTNITPGEMQVSDLSENKYCPHLEALLKGEECVEQ